MARAAPCKGARARARMLLMAPSPIDRPNTSPIGGARRSMPMAWAQRPPDGRTCVTSGRPGGRAAVGCARRRAAGPARPAGTPRRTSGRRRGDGQRQIGVRAQGAPRARPALAIRARSGRRDSLSLALRRRLGQLADPRPQRLDPGALRLYGRLCRRHLRRQGHDQRVLVGAGQLAEVGAGGRPAVRIDSAVTAPSTICGQPRNRALPSKGSAKP